MSKTSSADRAVAPSLTGVDLAAVGAETGIRTAAADRETGNSPLARVLVARLAVRRPTIPADRTNVGAPAADAPEAPRAVVALAAERVPSASAIAQA